MGALVGYGYSYYPENLRGPSGQILTVAGERLTSQPPVTFAFSGEYLRNLQALGPNSKGYVRADYRHESNLYAADPTLSFYNAIDAAHQPQGYSVLNIRLGMTHGGWDVSAYVNNLTNSDPFAGFTNLGGVYVGGAGMAPRAFGVTTWYRF